MKKIYTILFAISASVLLFNACTKETVTREEYNPDIRIYGIWKVVERNNTNVTDFQFLNFTSKKVMNAFLKNTLGFRSSLVSNFVPSSDQVITDLYGWGQSMIFNYSFSGDTLLLETGGIVVIKSLKGQESDIAGWAEEISKTDEITGLFTGRDYGIGFDGINLLIPDYGNNKITRINLSTRLPNGEIMVDGSYPYTVEFDGTDLWVSNNGWGLINKHPLTGGSSTASITTGAWIYGLAYDPGSNTIIGFSASDDSLYVCNKNTNTVISTRYIGNGFKDMAWSNGKLFITRGSYIYRINMTGFIIEKTYKLKTEEYIAGIAAVGNDFWLNIAGNKLVKVILN